MVKVEVYEKPACPYCRRAKGLLRHKGVNFTSTDVSWNWRARDEMTRRSHGRRSVPQIFINGIHIGGCDDLYELDGRGQLDGMLADRGGA